MFCDLNVLSFICFSLVETESKHKHKCTNTQMRKYTNTHTHIYTSTQLHTYLNKIHAYMCIYIRARHTFSGTCIYSRLLKVYRFILAFAYTNNHTHTFTHISIAEFTYIRLPMIHYIYIYIYIFYNKSTKYPSNEVY